MSRLTDSGRDHSRTFFTIRHTDAAFVRMRRKVFQYSIAVPQQFMHRLERSDLLIVAVRAGMIVGPCDGFIVGIVASVPRGIGVLMAAMEEMCATNSAQRAQRRSQVLMIAGGYESAASLHKPRDPLTVWNSQSVSSVDSKQPELSKISCIEHAQECVIAVGVCLAIADSDFVEQSAAIVTD